MTTPSELYGWALYFNQRQSTHEKLDYLAASICNAIFRSQGDKTSDIGKHLLTLGEPERPKPQSLDDKKAAWAAAVGIKWEPENV